MRKKDLKKLSGKNAAKKAVMACAAFSVLTAGCAYAEDVFISDYPNAYVKEVADNGYQIFVTERNESGLADPDGKVVIIPENSEIVTTDPYVDETGNVMTYGYVVREYTDTGKTLYSFIDKKGRVVVPKQFNSILTDETDKGIIGISLDGCQIDGAADEENDRLEGEQEVMPEGYEYAGYKYYKVETKEDETFEVVKKYVFVNAENEDKDSTVKVLTEIEQTGMEEVTYIEVPSEYHIGLVSSIMDGDNNYYLDIKFSDVEETEENISFYDWTKSILMDKEGNIILNEINNTDFSEITPNYADGKIYGFTVTGYQTPEMNESDNSDSNWSEPSYSYFYNIEGKKILEIENGCISLCTNSDDLSAYGFVVNYYGEDLEENSVVFFDLDGNERFDMNDFWIEGCHDQLMKVSLMEEDTGEWSEYLLDTNGEKVAGPFSDIQWDGNNWRLFEKWGSVYKTLEEIGAR